MAKYRPRVSTVVAYTDGDCWHLAWVLHERTGWPMLFMYDCPGEPEYWHHVGVQMPDGRVLDIEGAHELDEWLRSWKAVGYTAVLDIAAIKHGWLAGMERAFICDTNRVASRLLDDYLP